MKLYSGVTQPNPRRVTIYLAEKGLDIPIITINTAKNDQRTPEFLQKNPMGKIPVLELDDGTYLPESAAIVEYLEELFPEPSMMGQDPAERAQIRATERMVAELFILASNMLMNCHPYALQRRPGMVQYPDVAKALQPKVEALFAGLEARFTGPFLCGGQPSVADCSLLALLQMCQDKFDYTLPENCSGLRSWFAFFSARPSALAV